MEIINNPSSAGWLCPVCETNRAEPAVMIPVRGIGSGSTMSARMYHVGCFSEG